MADGGNGMTAKDIIRMQSALPDDEAAALKAAWLKALGAKDPGAQGGADPACPSCSPSGKEDRWRYFNRNFLNVIYSQILVKLTIANPQANAVISLPANGTVYRGFNYAANELFPAESGFPVGSKAQLPQTSLRTNTGDCDFKAKSLLVQIGSHVFNAFTGTSPSGKRPAGFCSQALGSSTRLNEIGILILESMELTYSYDYDNSGGVKKFPPPTIMTTGDVAGEDRHTQVNAYMGVLASRQYVLTDPLTIQQGTGTRRSTINVSFNYEASLDLEPSLDYGQGVNALYVPLRFIAIGERTKPMPESCDYLW